MRGGINIMVLVAAGLIWFYRPVFSANTIVVKEIEFRGLEKISKLHLIKNSGAQAVTGGISIDVDVLERNLKSDPLILSHVVEVKDERMIISIVEKKLLTPVVIKGDKESFLYEFDNDFKRVSTNRLFSVDGPVIIVDKSITGKSGMSDYIKEVIAIVDRLKLNDKKLFSQLSEIVLKKNRSADLILKGRGTRFSLLPGFKSFTVIGYLAGYFDSINYYPERIKVYGDKAFFRPGK